jgi:hypothetical protein
MSEWSTANLKVAFDRFIAENGRLPTAPEVDKTDYLPSSRLIQRRFGGLRSLREQLGYDDTDFGKGKHRSGMAKTLTVRGIEAEQELEQILVDYFGEPYVHTQKHYGANKNRIDFLVYTVTKTFGIDVFTTETRQDLQKNVAIKVNKYLDYPSSLPLYFVAVSTELTSDEIEAAAKAMTKTQQLPNLVVTDTRGLLTRIKDFRPYDVVSGFVSFNNLNKPPERTNGFTPKTDSVVPISIITGT